MIERIRSSGHPQAVAEPVAVDGPRLLLRDVAGSDQYGARGPILHDMVRTLVRIQAGWPERLTELAGLGVLDWRAEAFLAAAQDVVDRTADQLDPTVRAATSRLVAGLPARFAELAECGLPDTLVHGDFHPGNVRAATDSESGPPRCVLLDWGDCGIGHPMFDQSAFLDGLPEEEAAAVRATWFRAWRDVVPGADPERAVRLIEPISALRRATVYRGFLDRIEPTERVYHAADPRQWLAAAAALS
jgi:Ser/Thr protein kinase RdoA (MazF antagonist)